MPAFPMPCIRFKQRPETESPEFALLVTDVDDLLSWAAIRRRNEDPEGSQRRFFKSKISAIRRFFSLNQKNTIPPAVIVTLRAEESWFSDDKLTVSIDEDIDESEKPGLVIDGQHRLLGLKGLGYKVAVVALLNVDDIETAFQFLVINRKATPVSPDLIRTLSLDYQEEALQERLKTARLNLHANLKFVGIMDTDAESPFQGEIALVSSEGDGDKRFINPASIESCVAVVQGQNNIQELENDDTLCEFFYAIWGTIKHEWPNLWNRESKLLQKVSMIAFTEYMTKALIGRYDWGELDISDPDHVRSMSKVLVDGLTDEFWSHPWSIKISDSAATRDLILKSLEATARNIRSERERHHGVAILDKKTSSE